MVIDKKCPDQIEKSRDNKAIVNAMKSFECVKDKAVERWEKAEIEAKEAQDMKNMGTSTAITLHLPGNTKLNLQ